MNHVPSTIWLQRFREEIVLPELNDELILAFLNYLADLNIFNITSKEGWQLDGFPQEWGEAGLLNLLKKLNALCKTEKGFAVGYFLRDKKEYVPQNLSKGLKSDYSKEYVSLQDLGTPSKSSDLSNLQIVKKVGRQLSPFLEMEKKYLNQLKGQRVTKGDAQLLYRYILGQTLPKSKSIPWQQLSRRRHK